MSPDWHCLVNRRVVICIATAAAVFLTPHRLIAAVGAFANYQDSTVVADQDNRSADSSRNYISTATGDRTQTKNGGDKKNGAQQKKGKKQPVSTQPPSNKNVVSNSQVKIARQRQDVLMAFVNEHHPELVRVLRYLRNHQPQEFNRAILDLDRTEKKLATYKNNNSDRYESELSMWKTRSRIRVLIAQLSLKENPQREKRLREQIAKLTQLREQQIVAEKKRLRERIKRLDETQKRMNGDRGEFVDQQFQSYLRLIERQRKNNYSADSARAPAADKKQSDKKQSDKKQSDKKQQSDRQRSKKGVDGQAKKSNRTQTDGNRQNDRRSGDRKQTDRISDRKSDKIKNDK